MDGEGRVGCVFELSCCEDAAYSSIHPQPRKGFSLGGAGGSDGGGDRGTSFGIMQTES